MAMRQCRECKHEISTRADACPHCGAKKAKLGLGGWLLILLAVGMVARTVLSTGSGGDKAVTPAPAAKSQEDVRHQAAAMFGLALKRSLREPESVVWEKIIANDDGSVVCFEYRAKNGFGGYNRGLLAVADGQSKADVAFWNKHCAAQPMHDVTKARHLIR